MKRAFVEYRYQGLGNGPRIVKTGDTLQDVQVFGVRVIVDYVKMRFCYQGTYPVARPIWAMRLPTKEDVAFLKEI